MSEELIIALSKGFGGLLTPLNSIIIAFITVCGTLLFRRRFTLQDRRQNREDRCERLEIGYNILREWSQSNFRMVCRIAHLREENRVDDKYVSNRVMEIAALIPPYSRLDDYIQTGDGLEDVSEQPKG